LAPELGAETTAPALARRAAVEPRA
jgi:hypothetical protein